MRDHSRSALFLLLLTIVPAASVLQIEAQTSDSTSEKKRGTGTIKGRVLNEDGAPIPRARVNILGSSGGSLDARGKFSIITDEQGSFGADGLDRIPYFINVIATGYVESPDRSGIDERQERNSTRYYVGDNITIRMMKGGVITGKVTSPSGEPLIGIPVKAINVKGELSQGPLGSMLPEMALRERKTDDRGIYRLYGLQPGTYIIAAGGSGLLNQGFQTNPYHSRVPIYYPSALRDNAEQVTVRSGEEVSNIDLRYRSERGHSISGKVSGIPATAGESAMQIKATMVSLKQVTTGTLLNLTLILPMTGQNGYAFFGVPDGEYEVTAMHGEFQSRGGETLLSAPRRVTIRGNDLSSVDLKLEPGATVEGHVVLAKLPASDPKCETPRQSLIEETGVSLIRESIAGARDSEKDIFELSLGGAVNEKGEFIVSGLRAGRFRVTTSYPDDSWYVKAIAQETDSSKSAKEKSESKDLARNSLNVSTGQKIKGVQITLAEGAATFSGRITAAGGQITTNVRAYLLPAETEAVANSLRYAECETDSKGGFRFTKLSPGKYLLVTRRITDDKERNTPIEEWSNIERAKLRKEAEAINAIVELKPCQKLSDFVFKVQGK